MAPLSRLLLFTTLAGAGPILPRRVPALNEGAAAEAQQRDNTATRAFSNTQIKTSDGQCLFVDALSGDFRANLTPIQVGTCGATEGQGWDVITAGKHNNAPDSILVVSTLTSACANFDPRRAAGNQVLLFSCGGRADGGGAVTNSQLFAFNGTGGPLVLEPENQAGSCFTVKGAVIDIANCDAKDVKQSFTFLGDASGGSTTTASPGAIPASSSASDGAAEASVSVITLTMPSLAEAQSTNAAPSTTTCNRKTRTQTASATANTSGVLEPTLASDPATSGASAADASLVNGGGAAVISGDVATSSPSSAVPVSRGGNLNPTAAAEANQRDDMATRAFSGVEIRSPSPSGQCLSIDPLAGDFRENLIPIMLVDCSGAANEKWDVITKGVHNDQPDSALLVNTLVQGCITFDGRRAANDNVNLFPCGGRADGSGQVQPDQLFPFTGELSLPLTPEGEKNKTCILSGDGRLIAGACPSSGPQPFSIIPNA